MGEKISSLCNEFTKRLSSSEPVPGGGGAAALVGALAASLCSMAAVLSVNKKSCAENKDEIQDILDSVQRQREELLRLMDEDAEGFAPLAKAYSLPKDDPDRAEILYSASLAACAAPVKIMESCAETIRLLERLRPISSKLLISDVGCAAGFAGSGMKAAAMNVYVNTRAYKGRAEADELNEKVGSMLNEYLARTQVVSNSVLKELKGE